MASYEAPTYRRLGSLRELTLGGHDGDNLDDTFTHGTPRGHLTFS